jgi:protein gp37
VTTIEWTDVVWNPTRGCSRVSPGCERCYAERQANRFKAKGQPYEGLVRLSKKGPVWTGKVRAVPDQLTMPLRWRTQKRVFVNSMSDVFHEKLEDWEIDRIFAVMAICFLHETRPSHEFQILTKRAKRMRDYTGMGRDEARERITKAASGLMEDGDGWHDKLRYHMPWPLPNVWLGVSVENQQYADERIPDLLRAAAAVRFVSYEPALGPVDFYPWILEESIRSTETILNWIIVGGESGPGARPFDVQWARSVVEQCKSSGRVKCFVKQLGSNAHDSMRSLVGGWQPGDPEPARVSRALRRLRRSSTLCPYENQEVEEPFAMCVCDYDPAELWRESYRTARKVHTCVECRRTIARGEPYERVFCISEGTPSSHDTCKDCWQWRQGFISAQEEACGCGGYYVGAMWENIEEFCEEHLGYHPKRMEEAA